MTTAPPIREGAGKTVAIVIAVVTMFVPVGFFAYAGYQTTSVTWMLFIGPMYGAFFSALGLITSVVPIVAAVSAKASVQRTVRRVAVVCLCIVIGGSMVGCVAGTVWGYKVSNHQWPEPSAIPRL